MFGAVVTVSGLCSPDPTSSSLDIYWRRRRRPENERLGCSLLHCTIELGLCLLEALVQCITSQGVSIAIKCYVLHLLLCLWRIRQLRLVPGITCCRSAVDWRTSCLVSGSEACFGDDFGLASGDNPYRFPGPSAGLALAHGPYGAVTLTCQLRKLYKGSAICGRSG